MNKRISSLLAICTMALVCLCLSAPAFAQFRTSIQGSVTDPTQAVIPGATLTLKDLQTNEIRTVTSTSSGVYNFNALPPDHYDLTAEKSGFQKNVISDLQLIPEQANSVNLILQPGGSTTTVTVNGSSVPALDTETANTQTSISANQIEHMPVYERDPTSLIRLAPGALSDGAQAAGGGGFQAPGTQTGASSGGGGNLGHSSSIFATENGPSANVNGGQYENNGYTIDGISTDSAVWGGATVITPSPESIGDLKIVSNAYDAENGRFAGAIVEMITKSGTNNVHGSFFFQITRPGLNAYQRWNGPASANAFDPTTGAKLTPTERGLLRDEDRYNQWGGSIGGPLWKNRLFAFFAYEKQAQTIGATGTEWYPTSQFNGLAPSGSIASTFLGFPGSAVSGTVVGSTTCNAYGLTEGVNCRTIPGQGLNLGSPLTTPLGTQDLTWVSPANPGVGSGLSNTPDIALYTVSNPTTTDFQQFNGRMDGQIGSKDHAAFVIYWVPATKTNLNGALGYQLFHHEQVNDAFSGIWNHIFSPNFLNEARANAAGWRYNELASNPQAPFGLPQTLWYAVNGLNFGNISLGQLGVTVPSNLNQWTYGYKDVATMVHGSQTWKFGGELTRLYYLNDPIGAPNYTFYNIWDFLNDAPEAEGGPFQATTGYPGGFRNDNRENLWGFFFQDNWKARPNLTLTAGLRYSYFGPMSDKDRNMGVLRFGSGSDFLTGITITPGINAWNAQKLNFGPQVGFNWAPGYFNNKVVWRGGYGLNYNQEQIANANANDFNPPGTSSVPGTSTSPTNINPNILYATSSNPHSLIGYPPNPSVITTFNSSGLPTVGEANLNALTNNLPTQYVHHWSLETEMDLSHGWVGTITYLGSSGKHLLFNYDANGYGVVQGAPLNPLVTSVNTAGNQGKSNNNLMVADMRHQFVQGFSLEGQWTWAHSLDTNSGPYFRSPYIYNTQFAYGRSDFDIRNTFKLFGIWQPLIFHGNDWKEKIAGGWTISGIFTYHSGFGWTPYYTAPHQLYCNLCNYGYQNLRPYYNGTGGKSSSNNAFKTGSNFTNPGPSNTGIPIPVSCPANPSISPITNYQFSNNYFTVPNYFNATADCPGQFATALPPAPEIGRNSMPGPDYRDVDMNLSKAFGLPRIPGIGEGAKIEIQANFLNIFNTLNINPSTISTNIANSGLGQAGGALGSRTITFQGRFSF
jgi:hypothetical protein